MASAATYTCGGPLHALAGKRVGGVTYYILRIKCFINISELLRPPEYYTHLGKSVFTKLS